MFQKGFYYNRDKFVNINTLESSQTAMTIERKSAEHSGYRAISIVVVVVVTEKPSTATHVDLLFLLFLLSGSSLLGTTAAASARARRRGASREGRRQRGELVANLERDGRNLLESIGDHVRERRKSWVTNFHGDSRDCRPSLEDLRAQNLVGNVEDGDAEDGARVVHVSNDKTVRERHDAQFLQHGSRTRRDLLALEHDLHIIDDIDLSTGNLGGNIQSLEELGLVRTAAGGALGDEHVHGRQSASLRGRRHHI